MLIKILLSQHFEFLSAFDCLHKIFTGTCQENYMDYFSEINDFVEFIPWDTTKWCSILSNTFLNNWSRKQNEHRRSKNNDMVKRAKLSVWCMVFSYLICLFVDFISPKVAI